MSRSKGKKGSKESTIGIVSNAILSASQFDVLSFRQVKFLVGLTKPNFAFHIINNI